MASAFATVKLNSRLVEEARREAELFHRSLGSQIEHWARLGRAVENASSFPIDRVRAALSGELKIEDLSDAEQDAFFKAVGLEFDAPSPAFQAGYAKLGQQRREAAARRTPARSGRKKSAA